MEYALDMVARGCVLDLSGAAAVSGGHRRLVRRLQQYLARTFSSTAHACAWDEMDDLAADVDMICCGANGANCPGGAAVPTSCSPGCAVAMHEFVVSCGAALLNTLGDDARYQVRVFFYFFVSFRAPLVRSS